MIELNETLGRVDGQQRLALDWFQTQRGQRVPWAEIQAHADLGARLVTQAKGIYKPKYTGYALSARTLQDGPYPDKEVEFRADGSWIVEYFQEGQDPNDRDRHYTNLGMMKCLQDGVPIGFLIKRKSKPNVEYDVIGLGLVTGWRNGYFTIEGFSENGVLVDGGSRLDATRVRAQEGLQTTPIEDFDVDTGDDDRRVRTVRQIAKRRGQASFRAALLEAYNGHCCMTGCDLPDALEAAHIMPYRGPHSNHPQNGLLLRSDVHTLFDLGLIAVGDEYELLLADKVAESEPYGALVDRQIAAPSDAKLRPNHNALRLHREWAGL